MSITNQQEIPIHIGKLIQNKVEEKRLTYKQFGELIFKNEKTIPNIYSRSDMSITLLVSICKALDTDFFKHYYEDCEVLKNLRNDEVTTLRQEIHILNEEKKALQNKLFLLNKELSWINRAFDTAQQNITLLRENIVFRKEKISSLHETKPTGTNDSKQE